MPNQAPYMASGTSLKSHMTEMNKTMLELAQAHERIMNTQQQKPSNYGDSPAKTGRCF